MAPGDYKETVGRQRVVWSEPHGQLVVNGALEQFEAVVVETGTAVREDFLLLDDHVSTTKVVIPIMRVPQGATVVRAVAMAALASIGWNSNADTAVWAVDKVEVDENLASRRLSVVAHVAEGGTESNLGRIAYQITLFIHKDKYRNPLDMAELEHA
jgi:hypothetical protein